MSQRNETLPLILALLITAGILGGGFWWFTRNSGSFGSKEGNSTPDSSEKISSNNSVNQPAITPNTSFEPPVTVPSGTTIRIDGSTSMVQINQALKNSFEQQFPGTNVVTQARGSGNGIQALIAGNTDLAAVSRPLTSSEAAQNLLAVPVAKDAIAIVVGVNNTFRRGLSDQQVKAIFQGKITNWSEVGGQAGTIRVINRPEISGTRQVFQELVLQGKKFGSTANITTVPRDATTPILQALKGDGTSYATFAQVANQLTVRTVAVNGLTPEATNYPYQRTLFYIYKQPASEAVQAFLGYLGSPKGKEVVRKVQ